MDTLLFASATGLASHCSSRVVDWLVALVIGSLFAVDTIQVSMDTTYFSAIVFETSDVVL